MCLGPEECGTFCKALSLLLLTQQQPRRFVQSVSGCAGVRTGPFLPLEAVAERSIAEGFEGGARGEAGREEGDGRGGRVLFLSAGSRIWSPRMYNLHHGTHGEPTGEAARGPHALCEPRKQSLQRPVPLTRGASGHAGLGGRPSS